MDATLRLSDLEHRRETSPGKLMNVKVPADLFESIDRVAGELGCSKTAVVIALVNEGLDSFEERRGQFPAVPAKERGPRRGRPPVAVREAAVG